MMPKKLKLKPRAEYEALTARCQEQLSPEFKLCYACRAGIEGMISQGVYRFDLQRTRYWGLDTTHLHKGSGVRYDTNANRLDIKTDCFGKGKSHIYAVITQVASYNRVIARRG